MLGAVPRGVLDLKTLQPLPVSEVCRLLSDLVWKVAHSVEFTLSWSAWR